MSTPLTPAKLDRLRRKAKELARDRGVALHEAQQDLAVEHGYDNWSLMAKASSDAPGALPAARSPLDLFAERATFPHVLHALLSEVLQRAGGRLRPGERALVPVDALLRAVGLPGLDVLRDEADGDYDLAPLWKVIHECFQATRTVSRAGTLITYPYIASFRVLKDRNVVEFELSQGFCEEFAEIERSLAPPSPNLF